MLGFCTTTCVVGGTPCPAGWVCDTGEPSSFNIGSGSITVTTQTAGLAGTCLPSCAAQADVGANDGASGIGTGSADGATSDADGGVADGATDSSEDAKGPSDGASEATAVLPQCPGSSMCTSGTVAGPDCLP
jgi:hypothetical protein